MTPANQTANCDNFSPVDVYRLITSNRQLQQEVLSVSKSIEPEVDSIISAMITLSADTVLEIALCANEKLRSDNEARMLLH